MAPYAGHAALEAADALERMGNVEWRSNYPIHVVRHHELLASSPAACVVGARAGLKRLYDTFRFGGLSLEEGLSLPPTGEAFATETIQGLGARQEDDDEVTIPLGGTVLDTDATMAQLSNWAEAGVVEADVVAAVSGVRDRGADLSCSEWVFVVLGAGAAMGPLETLLRLGAHVLAVDLPNPKTWERLSALARDSPGRLSFPVAPGAGAPLERAGADLLADAPRVRPDHQPSPLCMPGCALLAAPVKITMDVAHRAGNKYPAPSMVPTAPSPRLETGWLEQL